MDWYWRDAWCQVRVWTRHITDSTNWEKLDSVMWKTPIYTLSFHRWILVTRQGLGIILPFPTSSERVWTTLRSFQNREFTSHVVASSREGNGGWGEECDNLEVNTHPESRKFSDDGSSLGEGGNICSNNWICGRPALFKRQIQMTGRDLISSQYKFWLITCILCMCIQE